MNDLEQQAQAAMKSGQVTKIQCSSKRVALDKVMSGEADAMSVAEFGGIILRHFAIRFNDRELGDAVRQLTIAGFDLPSA